MVDRYRELEGLKNTRNLDVVLMATVSGFGSLDNPSGAERRRFAELFAPVYEASSIEARRQAVAALSCHAHVPQDVCRYIGSREIAIAAPFLARSPAINDETLIALIATTTEEHIRAIIHRADLSQKVIQALIGARRAEEQQEPAGNFDNIDAGSRDDSEALRRTLKAMAAGADDADRLGLATVSELQTALLVRFARRAEKDLFAETLTRALGGDRVLARTILKDHGGRRLAVTLIALGMNGEDTRYILPRIAKLDRRDNETTEFAAEKIVGPLKPAQCVQELLSWQGERARDTRGSAEKQQAARRTA